MDTVPVSAVPRPLPPDLSFAKPARPATYRFRAISRPAAEYTGDFYFTTEVRDAFWFAVGDFTGHGLRAAIFMAMIQEVLEDLVGATGASACCQRLGHHNRSWRRSCPADSSHGMSPVDVIAALDRMLRDESPRNRFATIVVGRATADGAVEIVNAGHCPPIVARPGRQSELIASHGPIIGIAPSPRWCPQTIYLGPSDRLVLYTDGLIEAENESGEAFGQRRLQAILRSSGPEAALESVLSAAEAFSGKKAVDDITLFVLARGEWK